MKSLNCLGFFSFEFVWKLRRDELCVRPLRRKSILGGVKMMKHGVKIRMGGAKEGICIKGVFAVLSILFLCLLGKEKYAYNKYKKQQK